MDSVPHPKALQVHKNARTQERKNARTQEHKQQKQQKQP
jgi:hypothetical protein